ncbi:MAG: FecR domain-containing protein [Candidatus Riflebacteria bacterium]|nr:FecR domain-containing protein [Candidatus Riflebacteria bacterium]
MPRTVPVVLLVSIVVGIPLTGCGDGSGGGKPSAALVEFSGEVKLTPGRGQPAQTIGKETKLPLLLTDGSVVEVGKGSHAELKLLTGSRVRVNESSVFALEVFVYKKGESSVLEAASSLKGKDGGRGSAFFAVNKDQPADAPKFGRFEVKSASVVTAVMGTAFGVEVDAGTVTVLRTEGRVALLKEDDDEEGPPPWATAYGYDSRRKPGKDLGTCDASKAAMKADPKGAIVVLQASGVGFSGEMADWLTRIAEGREKTLPR